MADIDYDVYVVKVPKERKGPGVWLMSEELVPGCNINIMYNWIARKPEPNPIHMAMESHPYDEVIVNMGMDPDDPSYLGAEIEGYLGEQKQIQDTTSALLIPRGVPHGRVTWKSFEKPHIQMAIKLSGKIEPMGPPPKK